MDIEELKLKHFKEYLKSSIIDVGKEHTKLSIEFAISVLEEIWNNENFGNDLYNKIQELKQYLDGSKL